MIGSTELQRFARARSVQGTSINFRNARITGVGVLSSFPGMPNLHP